jgi:hypothetical protein
LTGPALARVTDLSGTTWGLTGGIGRPVPRPLPVDLDPAHARLYRQASDAAPLEPIAPGQWAFADCRTVPFPGSPDPARICLKDGFAPALAYTLVYQARDPLVLGIGFAATRDLVSFLRHAKADDRGTPNPLAGQVRWSVVSGTSQSGNFVKSFINLGFNRDEAGHRVFDGANPNIAARQVPLNLRFAVPGGAATLFEPGSEGTLWWTPLCRSGARPARTACSTAARQRRPAPRSWKPSAPPNSGACACRPLWSAPMRAPMCRSRPMCDAITSRRDAWRFLHRRHLARW